MHTSEGAGDYGGDVLGLCSLYIMTCMYPPPPHMTCMSQYPPPHMTCILIGLCSLYIRSLLTHVRLESARVLD